MAHATGDRVLVLVDEANFLGTARTFGRRANWTQLREYLADPDEGRHLIEMVAYIGVPPDRPEYAEQREKKRGFIRRLQFDGFLTVVKEGRPTGEGTYGANVDLMMAVDGIRLAVDMRPDIVVLVTGDNEFAYLAEALRRRGIRVEVASVPANLSGQLKAAANGFIDLTELLNEADPMNGPHEPIGMLGALLDN